MREEETKEMGSVKKVARIGTREQKEKRKRVKGRTVCERGCGSRLGACLNVSRRSKEAKGGGSEGVSGGEYRRG